MQFVSIILFVVVGVAVICNASSARFARNASNCDDLAFGLYMIALNLEICLDVATGVYVGAVEGVTNEFNAATFSKIQARQNLANLNYGSSYIDVRDVVNQLGTKEIALLGAQDDYNAIDVPATKAKTTSNIACVAVFTEARNALIDFNNQNC